MEQDDAQPTGPVDDRHHGDIEDVLAAPTRSLVAIGAAYGLNCTDCLRHLIPAALNNGILPEEVAAALAVAEETRRRVSALTDRVGDALVLRAETHPNGAGPPGRASPC
jgi:hypothetical protein